MELIESKLIARLRKESYAIPEKIFRYVAGKNEAIKAEIVSMYADWYANGDCLINQKRFESLAGSENRRSLVSCLREMQKAGVIHKIKGHVAGRNSIVWRFSDQFRPLFSCANSNEPSFGWKCILVGRSWWKERDEHWVRYCEDNEFSCRLDRDGRTKWGCAIQKGVASIELPKTVLLDLSGLTARKLRWYEKHFGEDVSGFDCTVSIRKSRFYHGMTNCPRYVRYLCTMLHNGVRERVCTVDLHACYWTILVSLMPDGPEKAELIALLQGRKFYSELASMVGAEDTPAFKVRVQTECLFYKSSMRWRRKTAIAIRDRWPQLHEAVQSLRAGGVSRLSDYLMSQEMAIMMPAMLEASESMPCLPIHDALMVPLCEAEKVKEIVLRHATQVLGFTPRVKIADKHEP